MALVCRCVVSTFELACQCRSGNPPPNQQLTAQLYDSAGSSSVRSTCNYFGKLRHAYTAAQNSCGRLVQLADTNAARAAQTVAVYS